MKKLILTLALVTMPTITVLANNINAKQNLSTPTISVINPQIENFFKTEDFSKISKNFNVTKENFDVNNVEIIKINENSNLIRIKVYNKSNIDYVMLMPNNTTALYEKSLINESGNGSIEQYDVNGILIANFTVIKKDTGNFNVKLNFVNTVASFDGQLACIQQTYDTIKKTCDKDNTCSMSCNLSPQCAIIMYGVATAHCAATGNKPPKPALTASTSLE